MFAPCRYAQLVATAVVLASSFLITSLPSRTADYPNRNITLVVPSPPGGGTDTSARIIAPKLAELLVQNVITVSYTHLPRNPFGKHPDRFNIRARKMGKIRAPEHTRRTESFVDAANVGINSTIGKTIAGKTR